MFHSQLTRVSALAVFLVSFAIYVFSTDSGAIPSRAEGRQTIIGSSKVSAGDVQGFVVIKSVTPRGEIKCGGMLIDPQWVATTTACVEGYASIGGKPNITVAVGCLTNEPYICVDKNNTSILFHQRRRELVGATRVVQYATAKLALIQIPRVVLGSGVGVFPVAAAGDLTAMSGAPSVLGMGDIANVSDVNKAKAPAVMKATVALTTDSACQTTYGSVYSSGLNGCLERTGAMLFCRDTGSPVIGNVAGQPIALGIMLSEKTLGTNESARCTATMRKMGYIDLTVPATRNWIRDTVRAGVKRPVVTRLDGLYGENAMLTNDRAKDIDISAVFPTGIRIGATTSSVLSVSENGLVALGSGVNVSPKGFDLSRWRGAPLIVPFFADANTSAITLKAAIGDAGMDGRNAVWTAVDPLKRSVTITWEAIRPAWGVTALTLPQNTFQLVLQNMNNGDVKVVLNYGLLSWNIGEKNCANPCNYNTARRAQIGLSVGNGQVLLHPASGKVNQLDLIAAKGTAYSVIRAGKFGGWDVNPAPLPTWTATRTATPSMTLTPTISPTATAVGAQNQTDLLAWYPLNGIQASGSTYPTDRRGIFGYGNWFDGTNDVVQASMSLANRSFSVAFWAAHDDWNRSDLVITAGQDANTNLALQIGSRGSDAVGRWVTCGFYANDLNVALPLSFDGTQWHHYACTYDMSTGTRTMYVDGVAVGSDVSASPLQSAALFSIGKTPWNLYYKGQVRDVLVYGRALSTGEVNTVANYSHNSVMLSAPHPASGCEWLDEQGNVHTYEINTTRLSWTAASLAAAQRKQGGQAGYLATITSPEEHSCLMSLITLQGGWLATTDGPWIGGQRVGTDGLFEWAYGPEKGMTLHKTVGYTNWYGSAVGANDNLPDARLTLDGMRILRSDAQKWNNEAKSFTTTSIIEFTYPNERALTGVVYTDTNANQVPDAGESVMASSAITLTAELAQPVSIVGGGEQFCLRLDDGRASCWGRRGANYRTDQQRIVPYAFENLDNITAISNGVNTTCLVHDAAVYCLGQNTYGSVGNGTTNDAWTPVKVTGIDGARTLSTGTGYHHCAVMGDGKLYCWGQNMYGQIGDGTVFQADTPVLISGVSSVKQVVTGNRHTCALKTDGTVWCWGSNDVSQLAQTGMSVSLSPVNVAGLTGITQLSAGAQHVCAIKADTSVVCWGYPAGITGQRSAVTVSTPIAVANSSGALSLATGAETSCITKADAKIYCWGHVFHGEAGWTASGSTTTQRASATEMSGMQDAAAVSLSDRSGCYLTTLNDVRCWGEAEYGQLGDTTLQPRKYALDITVTWQNNPTAARVARLYGGVQHRCAILTDMRVACWGKPGFNNNETDASHWSRTLEPYVLPGLDDVVDIQMGQHQACALNVSAELWCWGYSLDYYFGGVTVNTEVPVQITLTSTPIALSEGFQGTLSYINSANTHVAPNSSGSWWTAYALIPSGGGDYTHIGQLSDGYIHRCLLKNTDGNVGCWGSNHVGQLGYASPTTPTRTVSYNMALQGVQQISSGSTHTCALLQDATVKCWGEAIYIDGTSAYTAKYVTPQLVQGLSDVKQISSAERNCAVKFDGTVWCWGRWFDGNEAAGGGIVAQQIPGVSDAIQVDVSYLSLCLLRRTGDTWCLGWGEYGQLGDGTVNPRFSLGPISETWQMTASNDCAWVDAKGRRHSYSSITGSTPLSWSAASTLAAGLNKYASAGYLATISSQTENQCLLQLMHRGEDRDAAASTDMGRWLGGTDLTASGNWGWSAGPEAGMTLRTGVKNLAYFPMRSGYPTGSGHYLALQSPNTTYDTLQTWSNPSSAADHIGALIEFTSAPGQSARSTTVMTNANGVFQLNGVGPGVYRLTTVIGGVSVSKRMVVRPYTQATVFNVSRP